MANDNEMIRFEAAFDFAGRQVRRLIEQHPDFFPTHTVNGRWQRDTEVAPSGYDGLLPGMMWIFHDQTGEAWWREKAEHYCRLIEPRMSDAAVADHGMLFYHGGHRRWHDTTVQGGAEDPSIRTVIREAARTLGRRVAERTGHLRSPAADDLLVIEDMMNVPLLLCEAVESGDDLLAQIGSRHVALSRRHLVRGDGSTVAGAMLDPRTGECLRQHIHPGCWGDSSWARGQAWAVYGFAACGRLLGFAPWLETARQCALYLIEKLSADPIPRWNLDAGSETPSPKDSPAAAVAAAGLFELAAAEQTVGAEQARQRRYLVDAALRIVGALCEPEYLAANDAGWEGILKHGVGDPHRHLAVDESFVWGDFFFVEALHRAIRLLRAKRA